MLLENMFEEAFKAAKSQFWDFAKWRERFLNEKVSNLTESEIRDLVICGMNYPPSQWQIHLQFVSVPLRDAKVRK